MERTASIQGATILTFPLGGRRGGRAWGKPVGESAPAQQVIVDCDAWYHQAAMDEVKPHGNA